MQWLNMSAWKGGDRGLKHHPDLQALKKQNVSSLLTRNDSRL